MINTGEQEAYILVDRFIETGMPFAMYRIPGEKVIHLLRIVRSRRVPGFHLVSSLNPSAFSDNSAAGCIGTQGHRPEIDSGQ